MKTGAPNIISFQPAEKNFRTGCPHNNVVVDESWGYIECRDCHKHLDPIQYLYQLSLKERNAEFLLGKLNVLVDQAQRRIRTKCQHCGKITEIQGLKLPQGT